MDTKEIKVLMVEPGKHPKVTALKNDPDALQKAVSIGADYPDLIEIISVGNGDNRLVAEATGWRPGDIGQLRQSKKPCSGGTGLKIGRYNDGSPGGKMM